MGNIEIEKYKKDGYKTSNWSGGITTELAIYPQKSKYSEQNFIWRLSSATVDIEESRFTFLPDYDRILIVLKGEVVLAHKEIRVARLAQYEQDRFSGDYETKSFGKIIDFNLMVRKGNQGFAEVITITKENMVLKIEEFDEYKKVSQGFYCAEGYCVVNINKESCMLEAGELLMVNSEYADIKRIGIMGEGKTIRTQVYFNEDERFIEGKQQTDSEEKEYKVKTKITSEDIKTAAIVCWSNFRGGKYIFKSLKQTWYDEELQRGIDKIEKIFLPFFICLIGLGTFGYYSLEHLKSHLIAPVIILWILIDLIIINPLLYLAVLPRPVKQHIKKLSDLTESEKKVYEDQTNQNKRADKILKKYEITGRNKYID